MKCEVCGGQTGTGLCFSMSISVFLGQYYSTIGVYPSFIYHKCFVIVTTDNIK
jgi:hypothetical protein